MQQLYVADVRFGFTCSLMFVILCLFFTVL